MFVIHVKKYQTNIFKNYERINNRFSLAKKKWYDKVKQ